MLAMKKLLLDEMLGRLAKWLRIFGIDTDYVSGIEDDELLNLTKEKKRILITKDEQLIQRCRKFGISAHFLTSEKLEEQLAELKSELNLEFTFPDKTRCPACNHPLKTVSSQEVSGLVHENVAKRFEKFWICHSCHKAYWEGSHWRNLTRIFEEANRLAKESNKKQ
jgi:uncharacterized protein with PIN domain